METNLVWDVDYTPAKESDPVQGVVSAIVVGESPEAVESLLSSHVGKVRILKCLSFNRFLHTP